MEGKKCQLRLFTWGSMETVKWKFSDVCKYLSQTLDARVRVLNLIDDTSIGVLTLLDVCKILESDARH